MIALIWFVLAALASRFKSKIRLEAENAALRHQVIVLRRKLRGRVRLTNHDRRFFVHLYRWFTSILTVITIVQPAGISGLSFLRFLSLKAFTHFGDGFWRPVSASKNSVPGGRG